MYYVIIAKSGSHQEQLSQGTLVVPTAESHAVGLTVGSDNENVFVPCVTV